MIPEVLLAIEASRPVSRPGRTGESPSVECVWQSNESFEKNFLSFLSERGGTGQVTLALPFSGTGSAFSTRSSAAVVRILRPGCAEVVATVQAAFQLSITELASVLKVERPTVYAWMSDSANPQQRNLRRLETLDGLATYWSRLSDAPLGAALRSKFDDGMSVLDLFCREEVPVAEITTRLRSLSAIRVEQPRTSVRSRLNRPRTQRSSRNGDPDLLT